MPETMQRERATVAQSSASKPIEAQEVETSPRTLTKVVATIGPASESAEIVRRLILAGVSVFRFNFSHGTWEEHERRLETVRREAGLLGREVACVGDLPGPKIRVGRVPGSGIEVVPGQDVVFRNDLNDARVEDRGGAMTVVLPSTYPDLIGDVQPGHRVLINDGAIRMLAVETTSEELRCRVHVGGLITSGKGINLPQSSVRAPAITERDWEAVEWSIRHEMDYVALSFVRTASEVRELKDRIWQVRSSCKAEGVGGTVLPVIAKIEKPQALENIESIAEVADGIMVARGDLGVEMEIASVPVAQKRIIEVCHRHGTPCIVATQMLETMITSASPTRAEASDVANAVFDGADAVMLSGETAVGKYPEVVVQTMRRIVSAAESYMKDRDAPPRPPRSFDVGHRLTAALAHGAWQAARDLGAKAVVCWSQNAGTARYVSQQDFSMPIVAYSSNPRAVRRMALYRGVTSVLSDPPVSGRLSEWNEQVDAFLLSQHLVQKNDWIVMLAGRPLGQAKRTNTLAVHRVGEQDGGFYGQ
ncbi:MAG: pyruvate kinase [Phycisphaeraceae bacterium]|nr:pyruvate kinase [Phycisphaeraceae bacterium]